MAGSSAQRREASQFCAHTCPESVDQHESKYAHLRGCPSRFPVNGTRVGVERKNCVHVAREKKCVPSCLTIAILASARRGRGSVQDALAFRRALWSRTSASLWVHFSGSSVFRHAAASGSGYCQQGSGRRRFEQAMSTADQTDLYVGKERAAQRVGEVEHLGI